jgi:hypothetical protein
MIQLLTMAESSNVAKKTLTHLFSIKWSHLSFF